MYDVIEASADVILAVSAAEEAQKSVRGLEDSAVQAKYIELVRSAHILSLLLLTRA